MKRATIHELTAAYTRGETTPSRVTDEYLARIAKLDDKVGAYLTVTADHARAAARTSDERYRQHRPLGPLDGAPITLKDVFCTRGIRTTCASKILEHFVPPYDATVAERLAKAGAVLLGKSNMDEFAMGSSTEHSALKVTRNPWDLSRVPGGSSGGPAAAVAAGLAAGSLGTDTGGSIRQPAAFCGVVGLKPTYGRVSRYGLVAFASSLDHPGPFGSDVTDTALLLGAIAGHDPMDATSIDAPVPDYAAGLERDVRGLRLGVPDEYFIAAGFGAEVRRRIMLGTYVLSAGYYDAYYGQAQKVRTLVRRDFDAAFARVNLIVAPTTPNVPFKHGEKADPISMYLNDVLTIPADMSGMPAISVPCGFTASGLPIGLQLIGRALDEATVLRAARAYERATDWHTRHPELS